MRCWSGASTTQHLLRVESGNFEGITFTILHTDTIQWSEDFKVKLMITLGKSGSRVTSLCSVNRVLGKTHIFACKKQPMLEHARCAIVRTRRLSGVPDVVRDIDGRKYVKRVQRSRTCVSHVCSIFNLVLFL